MDLYVLRHGDAEPRVEGLAEADRKLTPKGKRDAERMGRLAKALGLDPGITLTSPYRRAKETAAIFLSALGSEHLIETRALLPDGKLEQVWKEIRSHARADQILIVGHEPQFSQLVAWLLGFPELALDLKKGGLVRLEIGKAAAQPKGCLKWVMTPRLARAGQKSTNG